jgi:protein dithiol oxidoreductase (disulfide-forming)
MRNLFGSLLLTLSLVAGFAHALAAEPVAGTNYEVLKVAHPTSAPPGKVEVITFFSYVIPQCYKLEPSLEAFVKKEGDRIVFKRVPVAFQDDLLPYSQLYYSLVQLGLEEKLTRSCTTRFTKRTTNCARGRRRPTSWPPRASTSRNSKPFATRSP